MQAVDAKTPKKVHEIHTFVERVPQNYITLENADDMSKMRKLLDGLEDNDDVQAVYHNWENEDDYEG